MLPAASDEAIKVSVEYDLSSAYGVAWEPPAGIEKCVRNYRVCVTVDSDANSSECQDTNATSWRTRSVQPCSNYSVAVVALGESGQKLGHGATAFFSRHWWLWNAPSSDALHHQYQERIQGPKASPTLPDVGPMCLMMQHAGGSQIHCCTYPAHYQYQGAKERPNPFFVALLGIDTTLLTIKHAGGSAIHYSTPLSVSNVGVALASPSSISVQWKKTSSCIDWYSVCVSAVGSTHKDCSHVTDGEIQWTSGAIVKPCIDYNVTVTAVDYADQRSEEEAQVFTGAPGEAEDLKVSSRTANTMTVAWNAPSGDGAKCLNSYELYVCVHDVPATCDILVGTLASSNTSFEVTNCVDCEDYDIVMKSIGKKGQHSYGANIVSYTDVAGSLVSGTLDRSPASSKRLVLVLVDNSGPNLCSNGYSFDAAVQAGIRMPLPSETRSTNVNNVIVNYGTGMDFTPDNVVDDLELQASWDLPDRHDCLVGYRVCYTDDSSKSKPVCNDQSVSIVTWSTLKAQYCSKYTITTSAIAIGGRSYPQVSGDVSTPPLEVHNLTLKNVTADKIHLKWEHPPAPMSSCLVEYAVHWCPSSAVGCDKDNDTVPGASVESDVSEYVIDGLDSCATYLVWVTSLGSDNTESEANFMYAKSGGGVPGNVSNLNDPSLTCGSMYFEWDAPSTRAECVANYHVCWQRTSDGNKSCEDVSFLNTQLGITSLQPSTAYDVTVVAVGAGGETSEAATIQATTHATMPVEELSLSSRTQRSISVSWKSPTANAKCAQAMCVAWCYKDLQIPCPNRCEPTGNNSASIPADSTEFNITDLLPCSNYTVTISVASVGNMLSSSNTIRIHTLNETPFMISMLRAAEISSLNSLTDVPEPVSVGELRGWSNGSIVTASWDAASQTHTCVAGYQVCWEKQKNASHVWCDHTTAQSIVFDTLPACEVYLASVRTITTDGSMSAAASVSLDLATPSEVNNLTIAKHSYNSLAVRWLPPVKHSECVENYKVCLAGSLGVNATCETISNTETEHSITGLQPKTQYKITLITVGPDGKRSATSSIQAVTDASAAAGGGNTGSSLGSLCNCSNIVACIVVILLGRYIHFSACFSVSLMLLNVVFQHLLLLVAETRALAWALSSAAAGGGNTGSSLGSLCNCTSAAAGGGNTGSSLGSLCNCSNIVACIVVILLGRYIHFSDCV
ncbi:hypothetical protein PR048_004144 [Dryococelus australis]|uniref:Fibronectin type-III domain-containing protein n=1 Tax=Dryococelus australis TaxID=614101 RepID=A0ABQ9I4R1_9NEOP|nr:hypothetical protein PR048_004144 [Dryococelus australis]